jgi:hypothetical protein
MYICMLLMMHAASTSGIDQACDLQTQKPEANHSTLCERTNLANVHRYFSHGLGPCLTSTAAHSRKGLARPPVRAGDGHGPVFSKREHVRRRRNGRMRGQRRGGGAGVQPRVERGRAAWLVERGGRTGERRNGARPVRLAGQVPVALRGAAHLRWLHFPGAKCVHPTDASPSQLPPSPESIESGGRPRSSEDDVVGDSSLCFWTCRA